MRVRLTDRVPNAAAYARVTRETAGVVTGDPRPVPADAASRGAGVAVFEATRRDPRALALTCLTPLFVLVLTPVIRPFRWSCLLLTYVVPAIPLTVLFDGLVSCLRTYTPAELRALAEAGSPRARGRGGRRASCGALTRRCS